MPALTPITQPPHAITQDEHDTLTSSTPASFDDIPPVLRWEGEAEVSLSVSSWTAWASSRTPLAERGANGDANNDEEMNGDNDSMAHTGKVSGRLYVTEQAVAFIPATQQGFALPFAQLSLHALTPAGGFLPAHVYCQIDEGESVDDEDEYTALSEMRIFVEQAQLTPLFDALSQCSALHASTLPSGEVSSFFGFGDDDDDDDDEWDETEDGAFEDAEEGGGRLGAVIEDDEDEGEGEGEGECEGEDESKGAVAAVQQLQLGEEVSLHGDDDINDKAKAEDEEYEQNDGDKEDDAITRFLAKVDWGGVQADGSWVDVAPTSGGGGPGGRGRDESLSLRAQLDAANARVAELEARLRAAGLEV